MKAVAIFSGGMDSATLAWSLIKEQNFDEVHLLTFYYGQKHKKELDYAKKFVEVMQSREWNKAKIVHKIVDLTCCSELISTGALTGDEEIPKEMYDEKSQKVTVVPNRNMIMLSLAAGYAVKIEAKELFYGAHYGDAAIYPDCTAEFVSFIGSAILAGNYNGPILKAPFIDRTKDQIAKYGISMKMPYSKTWSCYEGEERPCLECGTCLERTEAFMMNAFPDPALTKEEWKRAKKIYNEKSYKKGIESDLDG